MLLNEHSIQSYANCSMADVLSMSNQRTSLTLYPHGYDGQLYRYTIIAENNPGIKVDMFGTMCYSQDEDSFYNQESGQAIKFTRCSTS